MAKKPSSGPGFHKPCKRIDIHAHLADPGNAMNIFTAEERISFDRFYDADHCVLLPRAESVPGSPSVPPIITSEQACEISNLYPDHFSWFCNVNPDGTDATFKTLETYKHMGAKGVGEFMHTLRFDDPVMDHLFACCQTLQLPFLFHMSPNGTSYGVIDKPGMPLLERALKKYPNLIFIGHSQPFWFEISQHPETLTDKERNEYPRGKVTPGRVPYLLEKYPNLYADLSADSGGNALLRDEEYAIEFFNRFQDQLLFGSDIANTEFIYPLAFYLDSLLHQLKISEEVYMKICRTNAQKLLGI